METTRLKSQPVWAYLQLMRPANILTAWADILVGVAAAGSIANLAIAPMARADLIPIAWLLLSTTGLYGGGVVFNDVFDAELDATERPERPIPSGRASLRGAIALGTVLLAIGILAAARVSGVSAALAFGVASAAIIYDRFGKHYSIGGPVNMGLCRGGNLLLGISAVPSAIENLWFLALIPVAYIAAITAISQGEVNGGKTGTGIISLLMLGSVSSAIVGLDLLPDYQVLMAIPFAAFWAIRVFPPFVRAARDPSPELIREAVKAGVLSLIILDSAIAAGFSGWIYGLFVLLLLPLSMGLGRLFAIT